MEHASYTLSIPALPRKSGWLLKEPLFFRTGNINTALNVSLALGLVVALGLLGQQHRLDVGQDAALSDGHTTQQLVKLLVVADGQLQVARDDAGLLIVPGRVARQLQDLGRQVLQHRRQVHRGPSTDPLGVVPLAEQPVHSAYRELEPGARRASFSLGTSFPSLLPAPGHGTR